MPPPTPPGRRPETTGSDEGPISGVADSAVQQLERMLLSGEFSPGDRLPTERELAARLKISRNSVREAVRAMSSRGLLRARVGAGTYVTSLHPDVLLNGSSFVLELMRQRNVAETLEVRRALDALAASKAAGCISDDDLAELRSLMKTMDEDSDLDTRISADLDFHRVIARAAGNDVLAALIDIVAGNTKEARRWRGTSDRLAAERMHAEHLMIYDALARHDADLAGVCAAAHVAGVMAWLSSAAAGDPDHGPTTKEEA